MNLRSLILGLLLGALATTVVFRSAGFRIRLGGQPRMEQPQRDKTDTMRLDPGKSRPRGDQGKSRPRSKVA